MGDGWMDFLSYHFYIYFKIKGYMLLCCQRSVLRRNGVCLDAIKILTPTPYSLQGVNQAPFLTRRYVLFVLKKIAPGSVAVVVPSLGTTRRGIARLYSRVSLAVCSHHIYLGPSLENSWEM